MTHTPRLEVSQVQEYTCVPVECNSTPSKVAENVYTGRRQPKQASDRLYYVNEAGDRILLRLEEFGGVGDVYNRIC